MAAMDHAFQKDEFLSGESLSREELHQFIIKMLRTMSMEDRMTVVLRAIQDEPKRAIWSLYKVLSFGTEKHGAFRPELWTREHFMKKFRRHLFAVEVTGQDTDESGEPHLVHAAADLLLAWECEKHWSNNNGK